MTELRPVLSPLRRDPHRGWGRVGVVVAGLSALAPLALLVYALGLPW